VSARLRILPQAERDLEDIWEFIALDDPVAASSFVSDLLQLGARIAEMPRMGRARPELGEQIRAHPHGAYLIFYRPLDEGGIEIWRILHGARDIRDLAAN
jgi:toxin ParE1/3/4